MVHVCGLLCLDPRGTGAKTRKRPHNIIVVRAFVCFLDDERTSVRSNIFSGIFPHASMDKRSRRHGNIFCLGVFWCSIKYWAPQCSNLCPNAPLIEKDQEQERRCDKHVFSQITHIAF